MSINDQIKKAFAPIVDVAKSDPILVDLEATATAVLNKAHDFAQAENPMAHLDSLETEVSKIEHMLAHAYEDEKGDVYVAGSATACATAKGMMIPKPAAGPGAPTGNSGSTEFGTFSGKKPENPGMGNGMTGIAPAAAGPGAPKGPQGSVEFGTFKRFKVYSGGPMGMFVVKDEQLNKSVASFAEVEQAQGHAAELEKAYGSMDDEKTPKGKMEHGKKPKDKGMGNMDSPDEDMEDEDMEDEDKKKTKKSEDDDLSDDIQWEKDLAPEVPPTSYAARLTKSERPVPARKGALKIASKQAEAREKALERRAERQAGGGRSLS